MCIESNYNKDVNGHILTYFMGNPPQYRQQVKWHTMYYIFFILAHTYAYTLVHTGIGVDRELLFYRIFC